MDIKTMAILVCGAVPAVAAIALLAAYYFRAGAGRLGALARECLRITAALDAMPRSDIENLERAEILFSDSAVEPLGRAFARYAQDTRLTFKNKLAPDPAEYFGEESLFVPYYGASGRWPAVWAALALAAASAGASLAASALLGGSGAALAAAAGFPTAVLVALAIYAPLFCSYEDRARRLLGDLRRELCYRLPAVTATTGAAMLVSEVERGATIFESSSAEILRAVNRLATDVILPTVNEAFERSIAKNITPIVEKIREQAQAQTEHIAARQEEGIALLASAFTEKVEGNFRETVATVNEGLGGVCSHMETIRGSIASSSEMMAAQAAESRTALTEATEHLTRALALQEEAARASAALSESVERSNSIAASIAEKTDAHYTDILTGLKAEEGRRADAVERVEAAVTQITALTGGLQTELGAYSAGMAGAAERITAGLGETVRGMTDELRGATDDIKGAAERQKELQEQYAARIREEMNAAAAETARLAGEIYQKQTETLGETMKNAMAAADNTSRKLTEAIEAIQSAGTEHYEKAAQAASGLLKNVAAQMESSMAGVGESIAGSIRDASIQSAEIMDKLAERTSDVRKLYDTFYVRVEEYSAKSLDDMDEHISAIIARFGEQTGSMFGQMQESFKNAFEAFERSSSLLMANFEEQSRSMGLYAKEIDMDVSSLSSSLRESVEIFNTKIREGVEGTFEEFDKGLSTICERISSTAAGIREAVDALPRVLGK